MIEIEDKIQLCEMNAYPVLFVHYNLNQRSTNLRRPNNKFSDVDLCTKIIKFLSLQNYNLMGHVYVE